MNATLKACHDSPCGGHHVDKRMTAKVLQSGFYWPTLFKDTHNYVKNSDACQRMASVGKRQEMTIYEL
jgi:hypothetical protein